MSEPRRAIDVLSEHIELSGARVVDVGSGEGGVVRWLRRKGADAVGVECGEEMLRRAKAADPDHMEAHIDGVGQDLPFDDASADAVVFFASLHHVPGVEMVTALGEAHRVLRPGGRVFVVEPVAEGPSFEVGSLIDDETEVRAQAQDALAQASTLGFSVVADGSFNSQSIYPDFAAWEHTMVGIDPSRAAALDRHRAEVQRRFDAIAEPTDEGLALTQPNVFQVLQKAEEH